MRCGTSLGIIGRSNIVNQKRRNIIWYWEEQEMGWLSLIIGGTALLSGCSNTTDKPVNKGKPVQRSKQSLPKSNDQDGPTDSSSKSTADAEPSPKSNDTTDSNENVVIHGNNDATSDGVVNDGNEDEIVIDIPNNKNYDAYLARFAWLESRNVKNIVNEYGYMGLWQIGYVELYEAGFVSSDYEFNTDLAKQYNVSNQKDFLNSEDAQKAAVIEYEKRLWYFICNYGLDSYIGSTIDGHEITAAGLLAAAHFGIGNLNKHIKDETLSEFSEGYGMKAVTYIDEFEGYDVSEITG